MLEKIDHFERNQSKPLIQTQDGEFYTINIATIYGTKIKNIRIQINRQF